jgi:hypothetical protein
MKNYEKLEKSKGVLYFVFDTDQFLYSKIAEQSAKLVKKFLGLPITIITDQQTNIDFDVDNIIRVNTDNEITNTRYSSSVGHNTSWRNGYRYLAYALSPYDETFVLDIDYLVLNNNLLKLSETSLDYCLYKNNQYIDLETNHVETMGIFSLPYLWATAIFFRKTKASELLFDLVKRVQFNYSYYRALYNISAGNYRNDYAFTIADNVLKGYQLTAHIPWNLKTVTKNIKNLTYRDNKVFVSYQDTALVLPMDDLHILDKIFLQSENFKLFTTEVISA